MKFSKLVYLTLVAIGFSSTAMAAPIGTCDKAKLVVAPDKNIEFRVVFHNEFSDQIQVDQGPRTEVVTKSYKVRIGKSSDRVEQKIILPEAFDLSQSNEQVMKTLVFSVDNRGGTNPKDHQPIFVNLDKEKRELTVAVDLENKSIDSRPIHWTVQIAQPRMVTETVEVYPTKMIAAGLKRMLNAMDGTFDNTTIAFNRMNAARYASVVHTASRCVVKSYKFVDGSAYMAVDEINNPVTILGNQKTAKVVVELKDISSTPTQGQLLPRLVSVL